MNQLEICTTSDTVESRPPCSNEYFRIFDYLPNKDWNAGFIVEMIPGLYGSPVHQLVIVKEISGKFKIVNQYLNKMLEGKYPERQAYNSNGILVTFPTPEYKQKAIQRGTHFEENPKKGQANVFTGDEQPEQPSAQQIEFEPQQTQSVQQPEPQQKQA